MKYLTLFAAAVLAVALAGCGGGGDNSNTGPDQTLSDPRIEAVVRVERTNLRDRNQYTDDELLDPQIVDPADLIEPTAFGVQDLDNLQTGENYNFQLVAYSSTGRRVILPALFSTTDTDFRYGLLGNSGIFNASDIPTGEAVVTVSAEYQGARYTTRMQVRQRQVRVIGRVLSEDENNTPLQGITVEFFDGTGLLVGTVRSAYDGSFRASVPLSTRSMTVNSQLLPNDFYRSYVTGGLRYDAGEVGCRTPVFFTATGTTTIDPIYVTPRVNGQGTPAPTGCNANPN
jgi:hypothetical protein